MSAVFTLILACLNGLGDTLPLLLAAALHEAGHLAACLVLHVPIRFFRPSAVGAVIGYDPCALSYGHEVVIALAGPACGLLGAIVATGMPDGRATYLFGISSLSLALFNLLPIRPLDGGVALEAMLCACISPDFAARTLTILSLAGTVLLWMCAVAVQLRCGGNLSLLVISIYMLTSLATH